MSDFLNNDIFDSEYDLLVIPISTEGTTSTPFKNGLANLKIPAKVWANKNYKLGDVKIFRKKNNKYIAFACSVDKGSSAYYAIRLIGKRLAKKSRELEIVRRIVTPILGTGAGKLDPHFSLDIMRSAFVESEPIDGTRLIFCTPDEDVYTSVSESMRDKYVPSAQLVIEAEIPNIRANEFVEKIQYAKDFYFELAVKKFQEYEAYQAHSENFYTQLFDEFNASELTFKEFLYSDITIAQLKFTRLCGELIAYIDYHAYHKNIWNKYPDKRVLARSSVRQNDWFVNLIRFKLTNNLNSISPSIRNAFIYLKSPEYNFTMLSENHRRKVFENIFPKRFYKEFEEVVLNLFAGLGFTPQHRANFGALCSRILYLPFIKPVWDEDISTITVSEENTEQYDLSIVSSLIEECLKTKSKSLDLGNCGLNDLKIIPELFECIHIEELILSNEWGEYRDGKWRKLKSKNQGRKNNIQSLPDSISELSNLRILICGGDWNEHDEGKWNRWGITTLAPITKLEKLEYLNLSNNELTSLVGLNKLINLRIAHLNNNKIAKVEALNDLINLNQLYLSNNKITTVEFLSSLPGIQTLDLHNNLIRDLRPIKNLIEQIGIGNVKWTADTINIAKNSLEHPTMNFVMLGKDDVLGFFKDIEKRGRYINKDIKIILVGNSEVGKSTFVKYLDKETDLDNDHLPTLWMDEKIIKSKYAIGTIGEECLLHVFDFGGHDYYHDTHHLFFGINTIYILLWEKGTDKFAIRECRQKNKDGEDVKVETQDYPLKYWLDSVKFYTRDVEADNFEFEIKREGTYNSSLLVIQNKVDDASKIGFQENKTLKNNYSFIYDIINISIIPKRNLAHFDNLFLEMLNKMNIIGAILPKFYEPVKKEILSYKGKPILSFAEFLDYCNKLLNDPIDEAECRRLVKYLNQVGILLYINTGTQEKIYVNKKWVIDNMHKILERLTDEKGRFSRNYAMKILGTNEKIVDDVLTMMQEFKIVFKHPASDVFIAPLYLPNTPDEKVSLFLKKNQIPYRRFVYNGFIHKSVILSIFKKFGSVFPLEKSMDTYYYWKNGLIIKNPVTEEIIMIKFLPGKEDGNACMDIFELTTNEKNIFREDVLKYIREVNQGYEIEEMVTLDGLDFISKEVLENNAMIGKHIFTEKKLADLGKNKEEEKYFNIKDYMKFMSNPVKKKKVVISYSKYDLEHVNLFLRYLRPLEVSDLIEEPWCCECLITGDPWDEKIRSRFNEADIVFFMVSENLFSTDYVLKNEITNAIDRYNKDNSSVKIVPIVLEYYDWGGKEPYNLKRFSAMPFKGKPISDFDNPKIAWYTITQAVRIMIENDISTEKSGAPNREIQEIYERQVAGKLDNNSI